MRSLLAAIAFAGMAGGALTVAQSQSMPDATPSICPSPSAANSLVDSTMQHDCVTPKPSSTPIPVRHSPPPAPTPSSGATPRPTAQPTSKAQMR